MIALTSILRALLYSAIVALGIANAAQAGTKCLTVEVIKPERMFHGTTAFIDNSGPASRIVECDAEGNTVWEYDIPASLQPRMRFTSDLKWLPGQDRFLFLSRGRGIFEVDRGKSVTWSYATNKASHDARRLLGGNTLFAWGGDADDDAQPLPNGNLLVTLLVQPGYFPVREVARSGEAVWEYAEPGLLATSIAALPNGNVLLAGTNRIVEVTRDKEVVWRAILRGVNPSIANQQQHIYKAVRIPAK